MKSSKVFGMLLLVLGTLILDKNVCVGENILVVAFISTKSHKLTYMPLIEALGKRGHNITVLTPIKAFKESANVKEIMTLDGEAIFQRLMEENGLDPFKMKETNHQINPFVMFHWYDGLCRDTYDLPQVRQIMEAQGSFDLIFMQPMFNDCALGLFHKLKVPLVLFSPVSVPSFLVDKVGLYFPSFIPNVLLDMPKELNFYQRFVNFGFEIFISATFKYVYQPAVQAILREKVGEDVPSIDEMLANTSLILSNSHFSLQGHKALTPDIVEIGGLHSRPAKPLPKDLEDFVGNAANGFVLFSMGSAIKADTMPEEKRKLFLSVFSKLKQKVLWKWESESMPDVPKNVKLSKWLPQQDLLGHKNIKLFITHCGGGSTEEAIYHATPLVGVPMLADQPANAKFAQKHGFAVNLDWNTLTEESLLGAINEILENPVYRQNVEKLSKIFKDQPEPALDRAVFWVEYVLRHKGASHLWSAGRKLNYFQYHSYDVILAYATLITLVLYILYKMVRFVVSRVKRCVLGTKSISKTKKIN